MFEALYEYAVVAKIQETPTTVTLGLALRGGSVPHYTPGQCITVQTSSSTLRAQREYSISSAPGESLLAITVRAEGACSRRLCAVEQGAHITATLPHGTFTPTHSQAPLVMLAGGIGITPFRGIIYDAVRRTPRRPLLLLHSVRTREDLAFGQNLCALSQTHKTLRVKKFVTRECDAALDTLFRRICTEDALDPHTSREKAEFLVCGSTAFVFGQQRNLETAGVLREQIKTECFF